MDFIRVGHALGGTKAAGDLSHWRNLGKTLAKIDHLSQPGSEPKTNLPYFLISGLLLADLA
jgi:hypothetical protein